MVKGQAEALKKLWTGKCSIFEQRSVVDPITHITSFKAVAVVENEPCRLSYPTSNDVYVDESNTVQELKAPVTLFIRPDLVILEGSRITVTQNGRTVEYKASGTPSVHSCHQEVKLTVVKEYA